MPIAAKSHRSHSRKILAQLEAHQHITQRALARNLGIALGLTNQLLRRLALKGWIEVSYSRPKAARYVLTPEGVTERARQKRHRREAAVRLYMETREIIRRRFEALSAEWPHESASPDEPASALQPKRIAFYGANEVAEIGYAGLQGTDLELVGVVDDTRSGRFFDVGVYPSRWLTGHGVNGQAFRYVVIMSFKNVDAIRHRLEQHGLPSDRIVSL